MSEIVSCVSVGSPFSNSLYPYNNGMDTSFDGVVDAFAFIGTFTTPYILYGNSYQDVYVSCMQIMLCLIIYKIYYSKYYIPRLAQMVKFPSELALSFLILSWLHHLH